MSGHAEARAIARLDDARVRSPETERDAPQGVAAEGNFVFSELKTDLDLLPEDVIDAVVRHYRFDRQLDALIHAFAAGVYENLSDVRQTEAVMAYFALGADALDAALTAKRVVNAYLVAEAGMSDRWRSADEALQKRLSDQRNDRSGHRKSLQDHETYIVQKRRER